jgi:hypothetical protein
MDGDVLDAIKGAALYNNLRSRSFAEYTYWGFVGPSEVFRIKQMSSFLDP